MFLRPVIFYRLAKSHFFLNNVVTPIEQKTKKCVLNQCTIYHWVFPQSIWAENINITHKILQAPIWDLGMSDLIRVLQIINNYNKQFGKWPPPPVWFYKALEFHLVYFFSIGSNYGCKVMWHMWAHLSLKSCRRKQKESRGRQRPAVHHMGMSAWLDSLYLPQDPGPLLINHHTGWII